MVIHRVEDGQTVTDIARGYGVDEDILRMNNGLSDEMPAVGEELLVLTPTRTYVVRRGDSPERLALRFGIMRRELTALNPWIEREGLVPGRRLALRYDERKYGQTAANGYFYSGSNPDTLRERLPYLTYVTVASAIAEGGELKRIFDGRDAVGIVRMADKIPLLRIYCKGGEASDERVDEELIEKMIYAAISGGYKGITLGGCLPCEDFIMKLRKKLMGSDLILFNEVDEGAPEYLCELADGIIFFGPTALRDKGGFASRAALEGFAIKRESNRCMPELCSFSEGDGGFIPIAEALRIARRGGCRIERDDARGLCSFTHKRTGKYVFPSLENIKATLDTVHEYGYMGISYDIARTPLSYLMMYGALFGARSGW